VTSSRWRQIQDLFQAALKQQPQDRGAFLSAACADDVDLRREVESLLEMHERTGPVDDLARQMMDPLMARLQDGPSEGARVGQYRVVRLLASGGMGAVYLAERADAQFEQQVALKFVRLGLDSDELVRRFALERQILAQLEHPNIARLLDGGVAEGGLPYLVMEYIEGTPIDRYCDERRLAVDDRLQLFATVCDAVQYAHQNLVVHRDLKPGNIFVTGDGAVKLLDFGIAKLLSEGPDAAKTRTGTRWMTPDYASPEQARGTNLTTASDTYSLGVLLFELLTGRLPYRVTGATPAEIERLICETQPSRPSAAVMREDAVEVAGGETVRLTPLAVSHARDTQPRRLARRLTGDLDTIVLKALRKEPERRYATAGELADDLRRHLRGLPVRARPDTLKYRAVKFVGRHKIGVAASAVIALSLLGGIAGTTWQARRAGREARAAEVEALKAERVSAFLLDLFKVTDPAEALGREVTARELLEAGADRIEDELADEPAVQAQMMAVMGAAYRNMGRFEEADPLLQRALEIRREAGDPGDLAESLTNLGTLRSEQGRYDEVEPLLTEALIAYRAAYGDDHPLIATGLNNLGSLYLARGEFDQAADYFRRAIDLLSRLGSDSAQLVTSFTNLAGVYVRKGDLDRSDSLLQRALDIQRRALDPLHPEIANTLNNLGGIAYRRGDYAATEPRFREALRIWREVYGPEHPQTARGLNNLAATLEKLGDLAQAEELYRETLAVKRKLLGDAHPSVAITLNNLGLLVQARGDLDEAERLLTESLQIRRAAFDAPHPALAAGLDNLGALYRVRGDLRAAEPLIREGLEMFRGAVGPDHRSVAGSAMNLSLLLQAGGRYDEAEPLLRDALRIRLAALPEGDVEIARTQSELGACLLALGRQGEAEPLMLAAYEALAAAGERYGEDARVAARRLAELYERLGDDERAASFRERS